MGLDVHSFITPVHRNLVALKNKKHRRGHACGPCNNILVDGTDKLKQEITTTSGGQMQGKKTPKRNASLQKAHPRPALRPLRDSRMRVSL